MNPGLAVLLPMGAAAAVYLIRRSAPLAGLASAAAAAGAAYLYWAIPAGSSAFFLGREVQLDPLSKAILVFVCLLTAAMFLYAWRSSQGWSFFPFVLFALGSLGLAVMVRPFVLGVCLYEVAALSMVFLVQGGRIGATTPSVRYLILMMLALPCLLTASWVIDLRLVSPDDPSLSRYAVAGLFLGFAMILCLIPFQAWMTGLARKAPPMVTAFIAIVLNSGALLLMLQVLTGHYWLIAETSVLPILWWAGLATAAVGLAALSQRDLGGLLAYAAISDFGLVLMGFGFESELGATAGLAHVFHRAVGVLLLAMSAGALRRAGGTWRLEELAGIGRSAPVAVLGLVVGGFSLAGLPLTAGFASRWLLYTSWPESLLGWISAILVASACIAAATLRAAAILCRGQGGSPTQGRTSRGIDALILAGVVACLGLGLYPSPLLTMVADVVKGMGLL